MTKGEGEVQRKLKVLSHAEATGHVARTGQNFVTRRSSFYRCSTAYVRHGEAGLLNAKPFQGISRTKRCRKLAKRPCM